MTRAEIHKQVRTFGTTTRELVSLREWLLAEGCTHMAMESTGVYWKPIYAILEGAFEIVVANAQHVKKVPGRKTDVKDAEWIADLLCHGSSPTEQKSRPLNPILSGVGFNASRTQAVFYIDHFCGLCGGGRYVLMEKVDGSWRVQGEHYTCIS